MEGACSVRNSFSRHLRVKSKMREVGRLCSRAFPWNPFQYDTWVDSAAVGTLLQCAIVQDITWDRRLQKMQQKCWLCYNCVRVVVLRLSYDRVTIVLTLLLHSDWCLQKADWTQLWCYSLCAVLLGLLWQGLRELQLIIGIVVDGLGTQRARQATEKSDVQSTDDFDTIWKLTSPEAKKFTPLS